MSTAGVGRSQKTSVSPAGRDEHHLEGSLGDLNRTCHPGTGEALGATSEPADRGQPSTDPVPGGDRGARGSGEEGGQGHEEPEEQHAAEGDAQEADERVEDDRRGIPGQQVGRHRREVPGAQEGQEHREHDHRGRDAETGSHEGPAPVEGQQHAGRQDGEDDEREHRSEGVEGCEERLGPDEVGGLHDDERRLHVGDPLGHGEARGR